MGDFWALIAHSGTVAKIVLAILVGFSIFSWGLMLRKYLAFRRAEEQSHGFLKTFRRSPTLSEVHAKCDQFSASPLVGIFQAGYAELNMQLKSEPGGNPHAATLTVRNLEAVKRALQRASSVELTALERALSWLATTASVTPFIGLFGTVVGIINAFQGLGQGGPTTIQSVAPGISEALIATAAGLFAAIPAVIGYNQFVSRLKQFAVEVDDFALEFINLTERNFA